MIIDRLETFTTPFVSMVRVTDRDGAIGWGQISTYNADVSAEIFHRQVAPHVLGRNADDIGALVDLVFELEHKFPGSYLCRAIAGLDTALWDLHGRHARKSVCELLGGTPRDFPVYASSMRRDIGANEEAERLAELCQRDGYRAVKFRVGEECGHDIDAWPGRTEDVVTSVSRALSNNVKLLVDGNSGYSPDQAIKVGRMLEANGVEHFEEPCPYWRPEWTRQVTEALDLDVTGGEQDNDATLWRYNIDARVVDIIQPDVCYLGGITRTRRVAGYAHRAGIPCVPHSANLSMVTLFSLHLMGAIDNAGPYVEFSIESSDYYPWQEGLLTEDYQVKDGCVTIPDVPGWGVEPHPDWLKQSNYRVSRLPA